MADTYSPRQMIERLISFDTVSRNSNLGLVEFIEDYLAGYDIHCQRVENEDRTKTNLFARIGPPGVPGGIVLSGHTDVVPVDGQDWTSDPFEVVEREGKLFGRGTCDMKSFIAIALSNVPRFLAAKPKVPVYFAFSYDEEIGCIGVRPMVDAILKDLPRPEIVIVGEPTDMKVVNAHKEINAFRTTVTGLEAHSSNTHLGVNAVMAAAELIGFLGRLAEDLREKGDATGRFKPPYTTVNVGPIQGGVQLNIVPRSCTFQWEFRALPDEDADALFGRFETFAEEEVLPKMRAVSPEANIETVKRVRVPGLKATEGSPGETLVLHLARANRSEAVSYGTEAGLFQLADLPTVICGPGSIDQAHKPNEFVSLAQVEECDRFMHRLADYLADPSSV